MNSETLTSPPPLLTPSNNNWVDHLPKHDVITYVLSDLFCFNDFENINRRPKSNRKQIRPKICNVDSSVRPLTKILSVDEEDWDDFTQTEVTVIDTSVLEWKFDKVLYRRKNVWKLGDIKNKMKANDKNKLKLSKTRDDDEIRKRKLKKKNKFKLCASLKYVNKEDVVVRSKGYDQGKTMVSAYEKKQDNCSQVQEKRVLKKQIDGGSSVILIKSLPTTNKKDMSGLSKSCAKSVQK